MRGGAPADVDGAGHLVGRRRGTYSLSSAEKYSVAVQLAAWDRGLGR
jgi:hypothetical protein